MRTKNAPYTLDSFLPGKYQDSLRTKDQTFQDLLDGGPDDILTLIKFRQFIVESNGKFDDGKYVGFTKFVKEINLALDLYIHTNSANLPNYHTQFTKQRLKLELATYDKIQKEEARQALLAQMSEEQRKREEQERLAKAEQERLAHYGDKLGSW